MFTSDELIITKIVAFYGTLENHYLFICLIVISLKNAPSLKKNHTLLSVYIARVFLKESLVSGALDNFEK